MFLWISLHSCHVGDFRFYPWAKICGYRTRKVLHSRRHKQPHKGVHMAPHTQYKHIVTPRLSLGAAVFPKVSSCGPRARLTGELQRGWRCLACWMKRLATCSFCGTATSPAFNFHLTHSPPPPHPPLKEVLRAETWGLILPWSALQLYPSDKALCVPFFSRFCLTLKIELSPFCYLRFDVSDSAVTYPRKGWLLIRFPHGWWPRRPDGCG